MDFDAIKKSLHIWYFVIIMIAYKQRVMDMDKQEQAHEYALKMLENLNPMQLDKPTRDGIAYECFELADAMQAEEEKRKPKPELPSLQQTFIDGVEQPRYAPSLDEWQPDWSQAPESELKEMIATLESIIKSRSDCDHEWDHGDWQYIKNPFGIEMVSL